MNSGSGGPKEPLLGGGPVPQGQGNFGGTSLCTGNSDVSPAKINGQTEMLFGGRGELVGPKV